MSKYKCSLLVVDDEPYILTTLAALLNGVYLLAGPPPTRGYGSFVGGLAVLLVGGWACTKHADDEWHHGGGIHRPLHGDAELNAESGFPELIGYLRKRVLGQADRLARVGGHLAVSTNEDGGYTMRAWLPC